MKNKNKPKYDPLPYLHKLSGSNLKRANSYLVSVSIFTTNTKHKNIIKRCLKNLELLRSDLDELLFLQCPKKFRPDIYFGPVNKKPKL